MVQRNPGRPKDLKKRQAILEAAKNLFLELGYDGSSMDTIAQHAGVSKLTVYNHFNDKAQLFGAAIEMVCEQRLPKQFYQINVNCDIQHALLNLGTAFLKMLYSAEAMKLTHLMSSLVSSNLELVHLFYRAGPERTRQNMYTLFAHIQQLQLLKIDNSQQAAELFVSLFTDCEYDRVIWKIREIPHPEEIEKMVTQRLTLFLRLYPQR